MNKVENLRYAIDSFDNEGIRGWALIESEPLKRVTFEIYYDAQLLGTAISNVDRPDLKALGYGDINYGYSFVFEPPLSTDDLEKISLRVNGVELPKPRTTDAKFFSPIEVKNGNVIILEEKNIRNVFEITDKSFLSKLLKLSSSNYTSDGVSVLDFQKNINDIIDSGDISGLGQELMSVTLGGGEIFTLPVNLRNSNFISINKRIHEFKFGPDPEVQLIVDLLVPSNGVFLDIGSNWGFFPIFLAARRGFEGRIYSFEPAFETYRDHLRIINSLSLREMIKPFNMALGAKNMQCSLYKGPMSGLFSLKPSIEFDSTEDVSVKTLDSLNLEGADLIKIDVEGGESDVILGGTRYLAEYKPSIVFESWISALSNSSDESLMPFYGLREIGYEFYLPGWVDQMGNFYNAPNSNTKKFGLMPFKIDERLNLPPRINVLATINGRIGKILSDI